MYVWICRKCVLLHLFLIHPFPLNRTLLFYTDSPLLSPNLSLHTLSTSLKAMAGFAQQINRTQQDIGARRLNTVMHRVLEELSYGAPRRRGEKVVVDKAFVDGRLKEFDLTKEDNLSRYIL